MWKGNPVVASAVGGIVDQVVDGTGVLLDDPADLDAFGDVLVKLLHDPDGMAAMGRRAREHVLAEFAGDRHLLRWGALLDEVAS
jgi:trehalose synthase